MHKFIVKVMESSTFALLPSYVIDFAFARLNFWRETASSNGLFRKRQAEANAVFCLAKGGSVALSSSPTLSC